MFPDVFPQYGAPPSVPAGSPTGFNALMPWVKSLLPAAFASTPQQPATPTTNTAVPDVIAPMHQAMAASTAPNVPLPRPQPAAAPAAAPAAPAAAGAPLNLAPPNPGPSQPPSPFQFGGAPTTPGQAGGNAGQTGLIPRFVSALRGAATPAPQTNNGTPFASQPAQPSMGLLPKLWNDVGSIGKMFSPAAGVSPFNVTGSLY